MSDSTSAGHKPLPGHEEQTGVINCPECGRFVGPLETCPHCGARVVKRMTVRFFRWAAVLLATLGLFLLWMMVTRGELPTIEIANIERTMNFAYIKIQGRVIGEGRVIRSGGSIQSVNFTVDDGTGELSVKAYRDKARDLVAQDRVPGAGDEVVVAGSLSVAVDDMALWLGSTEQLQLTRSPVLDIMYDSLTTDLIGRKLRIRGVVTRMAPPRKGSRAPWTVHYADGETEGAFSFFRDIYEEITDRINFSEGSVFEALVTADYYKEKMQLVVNHGKDVTLLESTPQQFMSGESQDKRVVLAEEVVSEMEGQLLVVEGKIASWVIPDGPRALHRTFLGGDPELEIVYRQLVADGLGESFLKKGKKVRVLAMVETTAKGPRLRIHDASQFLEAN